LGVDPAATLASRWARNSCAFQRRAGGRDTLQSGMRLRAFPLLLVATGSLQSSAKPIAVVLERLADANTRPEYGASCPVR
jgi:hypothetical protein